MSQLEFASHRLRCCAFFPLILVLVFSATASGAEEAAAAAQVPVELRQYVERPDDSFAWRLEQTIETPAGKAYQIDLTSQNWQGIVWKHALTVHEPSRLRLANHVLLYVSGGSMQDRSRPRDMALGQKLAEYTGARVAVLNQVPNQPLFGGRVEDDLITETWLRYLQDGDTKWPLLFPMVKSAVRAMDAIQAIAKAEWKGEVTGFVITGGSKRGWTSWLTAAVDKRLVGTAPMVIDVLNFRAHMDQQLATWGKYSEQIADYSSKGLIKPGDESPQEKHLRVMMDPYSYLPVIQIPKLLIHGTNDPYWCVDATRFYWDDIVGPKYVLKLPNDGHGLENNRDLALSTLAVFFRQTVAGAPMPEISWKRELNGQTRQLVLKSGVKPVETRLWTAHSTTKDFRESKWESRPMKNGGEAYIGEWEAPAAGHVAYFGELRFDLDGLPYSLCSLVFWE